MNTSEFPSREDKKEEIKKLFDAVALGIEQIHQDTNIAGELNTLENDPEKWMEVVDTQLEDIQKWVLAMKDSMAKRKVQDALKGMSTVNGFKED